MRRFGWILLLILAFQSAALAVAPAAAAQFSHAAENISISASEYDCAKGKRTGDAPIQGDVCWHCIACSPSPSGEGPDFGALLVSRSMLPSPASSITLGKRFTTDWAHRPFDGARSFSSRAPPRLS